MKELKPTCDPEGVYSVKRTCAELGVSHKEAAEKVCPIFSL